MTTRPHDLSDLYLSPVALQLDHRLGQFEGLSEEEIELRVALDTDSEPRVRAERSQLMLLCLTHVLDTHGWDIHWVSRGLRLSHDNHELVLGVPDSVRAYLAIE
jgi:hypothetical protein